MDCKCVSYKPRPGRGQALSPGMLFAWDPNCGGFLGGDHDAFVLRHPDEDEEDEPAIVKVVSRQARKQRLNRTLKQTCRNGHPKAGPGPCRECKRDRQARWRTV